MSESRVGRLAFGLLFVPRALVADRQLKSVAVNPGFDLLADAAGVAEGIRQRFLNDAINADLHGFGDRGRQIAKFQIDLRRRHALMPIPGQFDDLAQGQCIQFGQYETSRKVPQLVN